MALQPGSVAAFLLGVVLFGLLACVGVAVGGGLLTLLRFPSEPRRQWLLAPFAATVVWTLAGNLAVRLGLTLAQAIPGIALASLLLAVLGIHTVRRQRRPGLLALVFGLALVTGLLTWPYVVRGLTAHLGSMNLDTFHYTSTAAALWRYGVESTAASPPFFHRYGAVADMFGLGRNHTYVLLAILSPLVQAGEPLFVRNLFVCWSVFVLACNLAFYRLAWDGPGERPEVSAAPVLAYVVLTTGVGWALVPALVGNWDNALLVSVGPALAGFAREPMGRPGYALILGATMAYAFYAYPELAPLLALFALPLYLGGLSPRSARAPLLMTYALAVASAAALLAPGVKPLWLFLRHQILASRVPGLKPGGAFAGGLVSRAGDPSAWWALGAEHGLPPADGWPAACGWLLTGLVLLGVARLMWRGRWGEVGSLAVMSASLVYFLGAQRYGYAGYKILSVSCWLVGRCLVEGGAGALALARAGPGATWQGRARMVALGGALGAALVTCLFVAERHRFEVFFSEGVYRAQPTAAGLARLRAAANGQPPMDVLVGLRMNDYVTLPWIYYALKDSMLRVYHPATIPVPAGMVWPPDGPIPAAVLDRAGDLPGAPSRFRTPEFALVDLDTTAVIVRVDNPNQLEAWGSWLGTEPITITLLARRQIPVTLSFEAAPGPSRPESPHRTLVLRAGSRELFRREIEAPTRIAVDFVVDAGQQILTLSTPEPVSVTVLPNGDRRPLLVSVRDLRIVPGGPAR